MANIDGEETGDNVLNEDEFEYPVKNNDKETKRNKRVAVIGAGFSGLTAAAELKRLGKIIT